MESKTVLNPSSLKTVDASVLKYYKEHNIFVNSNQGFREVPVFWSGAELAYQTKDMYIRDEHGMLTLPQIVVSREKISKDVKKKGKFFSILPEVNDVKGGVISWTKRIKKDKTSDFARANALRKTKTSINFKTSAPNEEIVYEHISIPLPLYLEIEYKITIRTEFQQQMNEILQPLIAKIGGSNFVGLEMDGWKFESFYNEGLNYETNNAEFLEDERVFRAELSLRVLGYIVGAGVNQDKPFKVRRENAVKIKITESTYNGNFDE
jgi:hypothetical protein